MEELGLKEILDKNREDWRSFIRDLRKEDVNSEIEKVQRFKELESMTEKELLVQIAKDLYIIRRKL